MAALFVLAFVASGLDSLTASLLHPAESLSPTDPEDPVWSAVSAGARLLVFFYPDLEHCTPHEVIASRALERVVKDYPDTLVVTVRPATKRLTYESPGLELVVSDASYSEAHRQAPGPRLEVWSDVGQPLLIKSLPPVVTEDSIYTEIVWARSFTRPSE